MNLQATAFHLSTLPSKAWLRRQHLTSAQRLWARLATQHSAQLCWTQGQGKLTHHQIQTSFQEIPNPPGILEMPANASTGHNTAVLHQGTAKTPLAWQLCSSCTLLWGQTAPASAAWGFWTPAHCSDCFTVLVCQPPFPYQLLRKPLVLCCLACFEIGLFNQEVNILYYCAFRMVITIF